MKLAKNDLIWRVSHPRTIPIVHHMSTLFLIRKKEKKAMTHVAQNIASKELVRSGFLWSLCEMSGVIGSF